jgi:uncharacterized OB-fold protein
VSPDPRAVPPQPLPDADTEPFWRSLADGRLSMCRCRSCGLWLQPPLERCRRCAGETAFESVAGTGRIHSFITQRRPSVVGYLDGAPYVVALVELDEQPGLRLPARIVGIPVEEVRCEMRVRGEVRDLPGGGFAVAVFTPAELT